MKPKDAWYRVSVFLKDKDKKPFLILLRETFHLWFIKKRFPLHYFGRFLYRKNAGNYKNFLDMKEYYDIIYSKKLNLPEHLALIDNKLVFALFCEKHNIPTPKMLGYNFKSDFFYGQRTKHVNDVQELAVYFEDLFNSTGEDKIFVKSFSGFGGRETHLLEQESLKSSLDELGPSILGQSCIHQVCIEQHSALSRIYPNSVNTIRFETYVDPFNTPHFMGTFIRFGAGGSAIDNVSSGGFYVAVDTETGKLGKIGLQGMKWGGRKLTKHPDSGFCFEGFLIPYFEEAKVLCLRLIRLFPSRLTGWDIAITPTGPMVIEANGSPGILTGESGFGGYVDHPIYQEIILRKSK
ncbi:MAG: sugar-transfer associated ATP-grasp domain-containing protein [Flavobacteriaceae bacterium]